MLKNVPKMLSPQLVKIMMEMGHGDEIVLADGNYPAASHANVLVRLDGLGIPELLQEILEVFPTDTYSKYSVALMNVVEGDPTVPKIWDSYKDILAIKKTENPAIEYLERNEFYERGKNAYAIVATGENSIYANILLKKGVVL